MDLNNFIYKPSKKGKYNDTKGNKISYIVLEKNDNNRFIWKFIIITYRNINDIKLNGREKYLFPLKIMEEILSMELTFDNSADFIAQALDAFNYLYKIGKL